VFDKIFEREATIYGSKRMYLEKAPLELIYASFEPFE
jgi:hypothetical protein